MVEVTAVSWAALRRGSAMVSDQAARTHSVILDPVHLDNAGMVALLE
jgi:hypothetical protein